jgi:hypothetical protein
MSLSVNEAEQMLAVPVPLTATSGKIRVKRRSMFNEYGVPIAPRQTPLTQDCYIEWQVGYDVVLAETEKLANTTLPNKTFVGANGKEKALYELSDWLFYLHQWQVVSTAQMQESKDFLAA